MKKHSPTSKRAPAHLRMRRVLIWRARAPGLGSRTSGMIADERRGGALRDEDAAGGRGGNDESAGQRGSRLSSSTSPPGAHAILRNRGSQVPPARVKRCQEGRSAIATRKTYGAPGVIAATAATASRRHSEPRVSREVRAQARAAATPPAARAAATTAGAVIDAAPTNAPAATAPERVR